jgi:hypothetical protein
MTRIVFVRPPISTFVRLRVSLKPTASPLCPSVAENDAEPLQPRGGFFRLALPS